MARILLIFKRKALFYGFILPHKDMAIQLLHFESDDRVEECAEVQTKTGLTAIKIKADGGWKTIDSVYDPVQEAKTIAGEKASNYLLLGAGSGYVACQITDGHAKHILIITGSRNLAYKNQMLLRDDNHNALKITIISSNGSNRKIFGLVKSFLDT